MFQPSSGSIKKIKTSLIGYQNCLPIPLRNNNKDIDSNVSAMVLFLSYPDFPPKLFQYHGQNMIKAIKSEKIGKYFEIKGNTYGSNK